MKLLLNDMYAPITSEIGFLKCDCEMAAQVFYDWQRGIQEKRGVELVRSIEQGTLSDIFEKLLPLTSVERRRTLFVPAEDGWTAYFDNGWKGGDPASVVSFLSERIGCRGVRAAYVPHTLDAEQGRDRGRYGAVIWEIYGPVRTDFVNTIRSVFVSFDGSKWTFGESGVQQEFENVKQYAVKKIPERFTPEMLDMYLRQMGINAFSEEFYFSQKGAQLIAKHGPFAPAMKEYSLREAQSTF